MSNQNPVPLILASGSPRRAKILRALGVAFTVVKSDAPEVSYPGDPERTVRENALAKGEAVRATGMRHVLSADTIVWHAGRIFGKPRDLAEAADFLRTLAGETHTVFTGVAYDGEVCVVRSDVTFRKLTEAEIADYVARVKPIDRAGAYDIDESGGFVVASYTGTYENIMGLPVEPLEAWGLVPKKEKETGKMIKAAVFDFGGVMTTTIMPDRARPLVAKLGIDWRVLEEGFARYRRQMDGDLITMEEMYARIWADAGLSVSDEATARIIAEDRASYLYRNEATLAWMRTLKDRGFRIGILTNMPTSFAGLFREHFADFIALADAMVISGEERLYKPQREIYERLAERLAMPGGELCFFDDVEANCQGARDAGWQAIRFISNEQAAADFEALLAK